jgi:hypothetical protein
MDARRVARADRRTAHILRELGATNRELRSGAGTSQTVAGAAVGMSRSQVVRLEDASNPNATLRQLNRLAAANGYKLVVRAFPDADPIRDVAHARLLERLRRRLVAPLVWRPEVPLPEPGDLRGWDSNIFRGPARVAVEAETRIRDGQALERRLALKLRDDPRVDILVLLIADTAANRRAVPEIREQLRSMLPADGREVLAALSVGELPRRSGMILL